MTEKPAQSGYKNKKPHWHTDWKSEAGGFRGGSSCTLGTPGSFCLPSLPPKNQLHPIPGSPLFLRWPSGAIWLFTSSKSFHRTCSHLLLIAHWSKMGHSLVLHRSQARPLGFLPARSSVPLESRSRPQTSLLLLHEGRGLSSSDCWSKE